MTDEGSTGGGAADDAGSTDGASDGRTTDGDAFDEEAWARELADKRAEKDDFFATHRQSPVPPEHREDFEGLEYFPPDPDYRVAATVAVHEDPDPIEMEVTDGRTMRYLRVVTFAFELDGQRRELHGYRQEGEGGAVFVPFRDKTTGQQTYEGGRYMELAPDRDLADGETVTVDCNLAYSPFCAFSDTFACPLPPEENWLEVAVEAGERTPDLE